MGDNVWVPTVGAGRPPVVTLEGSTAFRDLGGYPTAGGGITRHGLLYRCAALGEVNERDRAALEGLDLDVVVDLRASFEIAATGTSVFGELDVPRVHVPVLDAADATGYSRLLRRHLPDQIGYGDLGAVYTTMLDVSGDAFARAFSIAAARRPSLHLCSAGKDRTGLLSALLLRVARVDDPLIALDYAVSVPSGDSGPIERALAHLDRRWGGAEAYLAAHGVLPRTIDAFSTAFVARDRGSGSPLIVIPDEDAQLATG